MATTRPSQRANPILETSGTLKHVSIDPASFLIAAYKKKKQLRSHSMMFSQHAT